MSIKHLLILVILLTLTSPIYADDFAASYLDYSLSARGRAMGNALSTMPRLAESSLVNPAALFRPENNMEVFSSYSEVFGLIKHYAVGYGQSIGGWGFGATYSQVGLDGIVGAARNADNRNFETGDSYNYQGAVAAFGTGLVIYQENPAYITFGLSGKLITQQLVGYVGTGWGLDSGLIYYNKDTKISCLVENISRPVLVWDTPSKSQEIVSPRLTLGVSWFAVRDMVWAVDVLMREDEFPKFRTGFEYVLNQLLDAESKRNYVLLLRWGLNHGMLNMGLGIEHKLFAIDYSFTQPKYDDMSITHMVTLSFNLGLPGQEWQKIRAKSPIQSIDRLPKISDISLKNEVTVVDHFKLLIYGQAARGEEFSINGRKVQLDRFARFNDIVLLAPGLNNFEFITKNKFGEDSMTRQVIYRK